jgi:hypothetical protein
MGLNLQHMAQLEKGDHETVFVWSSGDIRCLSEEPRRPLHRVAPRPPGDAAPLDTRRYPRVDLTLPILYRLVGDDISEAPESARPFLIARSRDVSSVGLCLSLEETFPTGSVLALTIYSVEAKEKFEALARVVWSRPEEGSGRNLIGLQFVVMDGDRVKEERHASVESLVRRTEAGA